MRSAPGTTGRRASRPGFTLVEAVISLAIVTTMVVVGLEMMGASAKARIVQREQSSATGLARQLLSEIRPCRYADADQPTGFGPESGEVRATFDDVDDYNGYVESPPRFKTGAAVPGYDGWTWKASVARADRGNPDNGAGSETGLKRIAVTVISPTDRQTVLVALRSRSSGYDQEPSRSTTYLGWFGLSLQAGSGSTVAAASGANLVNQVP